ncbi:MAG TPA: hypothetical protein VLE53_18585 [Gemmatimonadaceae bacterium]|nr:hypothetical protein [Gemmatimonadaceae bacterium]
MRPRLRARLLNRLGPLRPRPLFRVGLASVLAPFLVVKCGNPPSGLFGPVHDGLVIGTWGGVRAAVVVDETNVHVHINCTKGDFAAPIALDQEGRFSVSGSYVLRAYPVQIGPSLPAQFAGVVEGSHLTLTVAVNDTVEKKLVVLGPVTVVRGREPEMAMCPICREP